MPSWYFIFLIVVNICVCLALCGLLELTVMTCVKEIAHFALLLSQAVYAQTTDTHCCPEK